MTDSASIDPQTTMTRVLEIFPGAQRALFRRYHIGGCASCAFEAGETLAALCARNNLNVSEVIAHIQASHEQDEELQISAAELAGLRKAGSVHLVDIRSREEFDRRRGAVVAAGHAGDSRPLAARRVDGALRSLRPAKSGRRRVFHRARFPQRALSARRHRCLVARSGHERAALPFGAFHMSTAPDYQKRIEEALRNPMNLGELAGADAVGTAGSAACGDMIRLWIKFKEKSGKKVIDKATFQSFGCETALAVASLATEMIRGKTSEEVLALSGEELAADLGPLPPVKIHCTQLVESALRSALQSASAQAQPKATAPAPDAAPSLMDKFTQASQPGGKLKVVFLGTETPSK
jgi:nitrogen fixation NifU-like protein